MHCNHFFLSLTLLLIPLTLKAKDTFRLQNLKTDYMSTPVGIDIKSPRFSWQMAASSSQKGFRQKAYSIQVINEEGKEVWSTGKQASNSSLNIIYKGEVLKPTTRYKWKLKVWNQTDKTAEDSSYFETGLMEAAPYQNWSGAKWIGGGDQDLPLYASYLPIFQLKLNFELDKKTGSKQVGFIYGANDPRLMDANKNIYNLANKKDESYIKVVINTSPLDKGKSAEIRVFRKGYCPQDTTDAPLQTILIPKDLLNTGNRYQFHSLLIASHQGHTDFYMGNKKIGYVPMNPIGQGGDFLAFPVVSEVGFFLPKGQQLNSGDIEIKHFRSPANTITHVAYKQADTRKGNILQLTDPSRNAMPLLRTVFSTNNKEIKKARLYVTAKGIYELYLNGQAIGKDYFNPGASQYNKTQFYQTFDITPTLRQGKNAIGACLGE